MRKGERFNYYMDYLHMLEELNTPLNDDNILFPENLQVAHGNAMNTLYLLERKLEKQQYQPKKQLKVLETEIDNLLFHAPHSLQEIVQEGSVLHHCVGNQRYIEQHTNGTTTIVFIRGKEEPNLPYFTLEYRNQQVTQIQGKRTRQKVPEKIKQAVKQWQENLQHALSS